MYSDFTELFLEEEKSKGLIASKESISSSGPTKLSINIMRTFEIIKCALETLNESHLQDFEKSSINLEKTFIIIKSDYDHPIFGVEKTDEFIYTSELIYKSYKYDKLHEYEIALKPLFENIIHLHSIEDYNQIDSIIEKFIQKDFNIKSTIGILMITHKMKENLLLWNKLIEYSKKIAYNADYTAERLDRLMFRFS